MKFLIAFGILFVALAAALPHHEQGHDASKDAVVQHFKESADACALEHNIGDEERNKLKNEEFAENPSENLQCFAACTMEKVGSLKDGVPQENIIEPILTAYIGEEKAKQQLEKCRNVTGDNKCELAYNLYKCYNVKNDSSEEQTA